MSFVFELGVECEVNCNEGHWRRLCRLESARDGPYYHCRSHANRPHRRSYY